MRRLAVGVLALAVALLGESSLANAAWSTSTDGAARARARTMPAGSPPTATNVAPASPRVALTWPASTGMPAGAGYVVRSFDSASGAERAITSACTAIIASTSCTEAAVPSGSWRYTVTPAIGSWRGASSAQSVAVVVDTTAPTVAITSPVAATTYGRAQWNAMCSSAICGTAADVHTNVASVAVSVRQGSGNYWNGTTFASATEVLLPATGTTSWSRSFPAANFPASGAYTVRAVATDARGNVGSTSATFTVDVTSPTATSVTFANGPGTAGVGSQGDVIELTFSEALAPSSICSAWTGTGNQSLANVTVSLSHPALTVDDRFQFSSPTCALNIGLVTSPTGYTSALGGAFTASTLTWDAATRRLRVVFGPGSGGLILIPQAAATATYTPVAAMTDLVGNPMSTTPVATPNQRL